MGEGRAGGEGGEVLDAGGERRTVSKSFPEIRAAVEHCNALRLAGEALHRKLSETRPPDPRLRAQIARGDEAQHAARRVVLGAYAGGLLPPILGGTWSVCRPGASPVWSVGFRRGDAIEYVASFSGTLVDHDRAFRRGGSRGPLTWENSVVISEPYDAWDRSKNAPTDAAIEHARQLHTRLALSAWVRPDLSGWFKGWTALVLIAKGLPSDRAGEFGFTALA